MELHTLKIYFQVSPIFCDKSNPALKISSDGDIRRGACDGLSVAPGRHHHAESLFEPDV